MDLVNEQDDVACGLYLAQQTLDPLLELTAELGARHKAGEVQQKNFLIPQADGHLSYAVLRLLVSMLVTVLGLVNKLPVIGTVNRGLGWLTGGMTALLDLYLVLCVVWGLVVITGGNLNVLNDTVMHSSLYYKAFNMFNPFL